jgi:hypothetical protein
MARPTSCQHSNAEAHAAHERHQVDDGLFDLTAPARSRWFTESSRKSDSRSRAAKAQRAVDGHAPVKRQPPSGSPVAQEREPDPGGQNPGAGRITGLHHQPGGQPATFVIDAYRQLRRIENAFRMSKSDLQARPTYHRTRDSIEAHLSVVFDTMAVPHWIEHQTG